VSKLQLLSLLAGSTSLPMAASRGRIGARGLFERLFGIGIAGGLKLRRRRRDRRIRGALEPRFCEIVGKWSEPNPTNEPITAPHIAHIASVLALTC
jgi:hypothetical protein